LRKIELHNVHQKRRKGVRKKKVEGSVKKYILEEKTIVHKFYGVEIYGTYSRTINAS